MTSRQIAILEYHRDLASFGTSPKAPVFIILDLEDSVGFQIASLYQSNCAEKRDAIKASGAYPALTLALPIKDANTLLNCGSPKTKNIEDIPPGMIPVILISEEHCLTAFIRRE